MMPSLWPIVALLFAVALGLTAFRRVKWSRNVHTASWLALGGGFVFLQFAEQVPLAAAAGVAALAGVASLRPGSFDPQRRAVAFGYGLVVPIAVAAVAITCVRDATTSWSGMTVVYAAAFSCLVAGLTNLFAAAGSSRKPFSPSIGLAAIGVVAGILIAGTGRSSLPEAFYGFPLRAGDEPLQWVLAPVPGLESGMRLSVAAPLPTLGWALAMLAALWGIASILASRTAWREQLRRWLVFGFSALGLAAMILLSALSSIVGDLKLPSAEAYASEVKRRLLAVGQDRLVDTGAFSSTAEITVATSDLAPEIFGLTVLALLGLVAALAVEKSSIEEVEIERGLARDHMLRGVAFLWLAWFVIMIIHNQLLGAPGVGSPAEWTFLGALLITTGLLFTVWSPDSPTHRRLIHFVPGFALGIWFIATALAWRFGSLPGMSLGLL